MKITTFNANSIRARLPILLKWLQENNPDVLAVQETKVRDEEFPHSEIEDAGYNVVFCGEKSYNGVAFLTKNKPKTVSFGMGDDEGESNTRLGHISIGGVEIINTYVPQGRELESNYFQFKLNWLKRLREYFDKTFSSAKKKVVWVGDLNVAPTPQDVHDPKRIWPHVCFCQDVIDAFEDVRAFGFEDVFRKHLPENGTFTFWDYRVKNALQRGLGWRIDHILATPPLAVKSVSCSVDTEPRTWEKPSDHTFVTAKFDL